ncbi:hypothetical protein BC628DRAFT_73580 [Trametes gibbosa]|nr:hypothetical protein BC628DRAFT_73580 [Trametes gibbosa]
MQMLVCSLDPCWNVVTIRHVTRAEYQRPFATHPDGTRQARASLDHSRLFFVARETGRLVCTCYCSRYRGAWNDGCWYVHSYTLDNQLNINGDRHWGMCRETRLGYHQNNRGLATADILYIIVEISSLCAVCRNNGGRSQLAVWLYANIRPVKHGLDQLQDESEHQCLTLHDSKSAVVFFHMVNFTRI